MLAHFPLTSAAPTKIAPYLSFQNNAALWYNTAYVLYYFALEPFAAVSTQSEPPQSLHLLILPLNTHVNQATYLPWAILSQLTVTYFASDPYSTRNLPGPLNGMGSMKMAGLIQLFSWLSQFVGHGAAEGRAPALLDNLLQGELGCWVHLLVLGSS